METKSIYNWKTNLLGTKFKLYANENVIGSLESSNWNLDARATIQSNQYNFKNKGFFNPYTEIRDKHGYLVADIEYSPWTSNATISLIGKKYFWSAKGIWMSSWKIEDANGQVIEVKPGVLGDSGTIESMDNSEMLLSICLYLQRRAVLLYSMIAFLPIFILLLLCI